MRGLVRALAFVRKEVVDVVRQPLLLLALIIGPFVILLVFGAGLREADPPLHTTLVAPPESDLRGQVAEFAEEERDQLIVEEVTSDEDAALDQLAAGELDLVIVLPEEVFDRVRDDEQAEIELYHQEIDPVEHQALELLSRTAVDEINNRVLEEIIIELQESLAAGAADTGEVEELNPAILVRPLRGETRLLGAEQTELADFYAPAVVVVLLQHLTVTLLALSVVRERQLGTTELFRVSPLRTTDYVLGKFAAYILLGGVIGAGLLALLVLGLGVPVHGTWGGLVVALGTLLFTSTALGLVVALLSRSDSQAVQYSMLILLATIFLSGFLLSLERFLPFARPFAWLLPATYGTELVRDIMLRGDPPAPGLLAALAAYGMLFTLLGTLLARRRITGGGGDA